MEKIMDKYKLIQMKKRLIGFFLICLCLTGYAKVTNEYDKIETGVITDKNYQAAYTTVVLVPMRVGKVTTMRPQSISHPAQYNVTCDIDGYIVYWDNKDIYEAYNENDEVNVSIHYKKYDDGTIKKHATGVINQ